MAASRRKFLLWICSLHFAQSDRAHELLTDLRLERISEDGRSRHQYSARGASLADLEALSLLQREEGADSKAGVKIDARAAQVNHHLEEPEGETETSQPPDKAQDSEAREKWDESAGMPLPDVPELPSTMYAKLKSELASDGPVEISIKETDEAGDETMKDAKEWRETERELQQATEDLGKASHKAAKDLQQGTRQLQKGRSRAAQDIEKELQREEQG
ncbi:unnamed protein product [Durusdinium trenchii]|uniref:Uncharacterized protein n=1 Tax=Durusdinium trenchii TaxID=1381693 RepID=A0ABP0LGM0_9DINO